MEDIILNLINKKQKLQDQLLNERDNDKFYELYDDLNRTNDLINSIKFLIRYQLTSNYITKEQINEFYKLYGEGNSFGQFILLSLNTVYQISDESEKQKIYSYIDEKIRNK